VGQKGGEDESQEKRRRIGESPAFSTGKKKSRLGWEGSYWEAKGGAGGERS